MKALSDSDLRVGQIVIPIEEVVDEKCPLDLGVPVRIVHIERPFAVFSTIHAGGRSGPTPVDLRYVRFAEPSDEYLAAFESAFEVG